MGCEGDGTVVTDLLPGFSQLGMGVTMARFHPSGITPTFPAAQKEGQQRLHVGFRQLPQHPIGNTVYTFRNFKVKVQGFQICKMTIEMIDK